MDAIIGVGLYDLGAYSRNDTFAMGKGAFTTSPKLHSMVEHRTVYRTVSTFLTDLTGRYVESTLCTKGFLAITEGFTVVSIGLGKYP